MQRIGELCQALQPRLDGLLRSRREALAAADRGAVPEFAVAPGDWQVVGLPPAAPDRRVALQALPDAESLLRARDVAPAAVLVDFDQLLPARGAALRGHAALADCLQAGWPGDDTPLIIGVRDIARLDDSVRWGALPVPAALCDLTLLLTLFGQLPDLPRGGVQLRLPAVCTSDEAGWWRDAIAAAADGSGVASADINLTIGVDSVAGVFAMPAVLRELQAQAGALAFGLQSCLRSYIHTFRRHAQFVLPDRTDLGPEQHFLQSAGLFLIQVAHRHGASVLAPVAATPDPALPLPPRLLPRLRAEFERQVRDGFDGTMVAHPELVAEARAIFEARVPDGHQRSRTRNDVRLTPDDLLQVAKGRITEDGVRHALRVALAGSAAAARGESACLAEGGLQTAAGVALAGDQLWQWVRQPTGVLADGRIFDAPLFIDWLAAEAEQLNLPPEEGQQAAERVRQYVLEQPDPGDLLLGER